MYERKQADAFHALVIGAVSRAESATRFYREHLAALEESDRVPSDVLESGVRIVREARLRIATAEGAMVGLFANDPFEDSAVTLRGRLQRIDSSVGILESFFDAYVTQGPTVAIRGLRGMDTWMRADSVDAISASLRSEVESAAAASVSDAAAAYLASSDTFLMRLWMSAIAIVYSVAFLAVLLQSRRHQGGLRPHAA
jgi:hypothetical protein